MTTTAQSAEDTKRQATGDARDVVADARSGLSDTMDAVRSTAGNVGDRLPDVIESVKAGASEGARTVQKWPESTQRLAAAFSLGLGVGLSIAGAPRLLVVGSLAPAIVVAATILGREPKSTGH